jgi:hypothetical protein
MAFTVLLLGLILLGAGGASSLKRATEGWVHVKPAVDQGQSVLQQKKFHSRAVKRANELQIQDVGVG